MNSKFLRLLKDKGTGKVTHIEYHLNGQTKKVEFQPGCKVEINGQPSQLDDLKAGDTLIIDGQPAVSVKASR